ncbi:MAG TPA: hypothetical protein VMB85_15735 [Bryobacteraceae bacterium]|nr:hypothetical protein [Bryobacteraceae bacterium]
MPIRIQPYTSEFTEPVADFNRRMAPAKIPFQVPETPRASWLPKIDGREIYQEIFLAIEDGCVRGAYTFKYQEFSLGGRIRSVGACQMPISEGILDKRYSLVGPKIVNDALQREPLSYGLGMGDPNGAIVKMLVAMGWQMRQVPFYFRVRNALRFLRNIQHLRNSPAKKLALDLAAFSGIGWMGVKAAKLALSPNPRRYESCWTEQVSEFSGWATDLWRECHPRYAMVGVRDARVLNILYPAEDDRFLRLRIVDGGRVVGWAVVLDTRMSRNKYFGDMRVGSIIDVLARPEDAHKVIFMAAQVLERRGVDLLLSNQSHTAWGAALRQAGFLRGPSNYLFLTSVPLSALLRQIDPHGAGVHMTRGDGDGPIHL